MRKPDAVDEIADAWARELPDAPNASIGVITRIWRIAKLLEEDRRATMRRLGMDVTTRNLLSTLRRSGPPYRLSISEIARQAGVTPGAVSQWVSTNEREGMVVRERSDRDGRAVFVALTDDGKRRIDAVVVDLLSHEDELVAGLSGRQVDQLAGLLKKLMSSLEDRER
ncbi:MarR family winged helix-turn-helix transcriptional regulator [Epidermidibacterium keratini]|uniref:MarR family winged helix-turn-helix transcriptional regulator n=1 Tax=Epidermidibacterium keratini TaxID=1891644 RepID=UPI001CEF7D56|nr:MarR family transcriptional regulator [Epidermidibacterium keratini]